MNRHSSPILAELATIEDDPETPAPGSKRGSSAAGLPVDRSLSDPFRSFARLHEYPRLTATQKRLLEAPLDELVREARHEVAAREEAPDPVDIRPYAVASRSGAPVTTANPLADDNHLGLLGRPWRDRSARQRWAYGACAFAMLACIALLFASSPAPEPEPPDRDDTAHLHRSYPVHKAVHFGDVTIVFSRLFALADRRQLDFYTINFAGTTLQGGVVADDGDGHQVDVVEASESVPARSVQYRVKDVPDGFDVWSSKLQLLDKKADSIE